MGNDVTFKEFVQFLLTPTISQQEKGQYEQHWERFHNLCHPCVIKYNFIGKYESMNRDADDVLKMIGANFTFPRNAPDSGKTKKMLHRHFKSLPKDLIQKLYKIYEKDFEMFDYKIEDALTSN